MVMSIKILEFDLRNVIDTSLTFCHIGIDFTKVHLTSKCLSFDKMTIKL